MACLFFDQVEKHFRYLINDYGFCVVRKKQYDSFDNAKIVLRSKECSIRVTRERGYVEIDAGPSSGEVWYGLHTLIAYLTKEAKELQYDVPDYDDDFDYDARVEWQVKKLAGILPEYYPQIRELFREEAFEEKRMELKDFGHVRFEKWVIPES